MKKSIHTVEILRVSKYRERSYGTICVNKDTALSITGKTPISYSAEGINDKSSFAESLNIASKGLFPIRYTKGLLIKSKLKRSKVVKVNMIRFNDSRRYTLQPDFTSVLGMTAFWKYLVVPYKDSSIRNIESIK